MDKKIELVQGLNWQTILAMFTIGWYFTREIRAKLTALENDVKEQGKRTDKLYEMFIDLIKETKK